MSFCTAINCMDGRVQLPVIEFCRKHFGVDYVDTVTDPGPPVILASAPDAAAVESIWRRVDISVGKHGSVGIVVVAHADCAGDPADDDQKIAHLRAAVARVRDRYGDLDVLGLWVGPDWRVRQVECP